MSNYTKTVNFAIKDSLTSGDPNKLIVGTDIDTEFNNIATAVNSKSDTSNTALLNASNAFSSNGGPTKQTFRESGSTSYMNVSLYNDQNSSARSLDIRYAGSAYASVLLANGPSGEAASIATSGAFPLSLGTSGTEYMRFAGNGSLLNIRTTSIQGQGATAAAQVDMSPDKGTFTATLGGCTTAPTGTANWLRIGGLVILVLPALNATSNATSLTITGLPAVIQPTSVDQYIAVNTLTDNGSLATVTDCLITHASGTITFRKNGNTGGWTNSGNKGLAQAIVLAYILT